MRSARTNLYSFLKYYDLLDLSTYIDISTGSRTSVTTAATDRCETGVAQPTATALRFVRAAVRDRGSWPVGGRPRAVTPPRRADAGRGAPDERPLRASVDFSGAFRGESQIHIQIDSILFITDITIIAVSLDDKTVDELLCTQYIITIHTLSDRRTRRNASGHRIRSEARRTT